MARSAQEVCTQSQLNAAETVRNWPEDHVQPGFDEQPEHGDRAFFELVDDVDVHPRERENLLPRIF